MFFDCCVRILAGNMKEVKEIDEKLRKLYRILARDPVKFLSTFRNRDGNLPNIKEALQILSDLRRRESLPEGNKGRVNLKRGETHAELVKFITTGNASQEYYNALFYILTKVGFSFGDIRKFLVGDLSHKGLQDTVLLFRLFDGAEEYTFKTRGRENRSLKKEGAEVKRVLH